MDLLWRINSDDVFRPNWVIRTVQRWMNTLWQSRTKAPTTITQNQNHRQKQSMDIFSLCILANGMRKTNAICIVLCVSEGECVDWYRDFLAQSLYLQLNGFVKAIATAEQQGSKSGDFIIDRLVLKRLCKTLWIVHKNTHWTHWIHVARAHNRYLHTICRTWALRVSIKACDRCWLTSMEQEARVSKRLQTWAMCTHHLFRRYWNDTWISYATNRILKIV